MTHAIYRHDATHGSTHLTEVDTYAAALNVVLRRTQGQRLAPLHAPAVAAIQTTGRPLQAWRVTGLDGDTTILYIT